MASGAPHEVVFSVPFAGQATAGTDTTVVIGRAPRAGVVTRVSYTPSADIVGVATNNRTLRLINRGQDGNGNTEIASLTLGNGTNLSDFDERDITLNATAANRNVAEGDILAWFSDANGSGMVDPGGLVTVVIDAAAAGHSTSGYVRGVA